MTEQSKPRELRLDLSENQGWAFLRDEHWKGPVLHVIEKSHADALEQRVKELEADLKFERSEGAGLIIERSQLEVKNAELSRKLAKAVEQRNEWIEALDGAYSLTISVKDAIANEDAELNGDK